MNDKDIVGIRMLMQHIARSTSKSVVVYHNDCRPGFCEPVHHGQGDYAVRLEHQGNHEFAALDEFYVYEDLGYKQRVISLERFRLAVAPMPIYFSIAGSEADPLVFSSDPNCFWFRLLSEDMSILQAVCELRDLYDADA